MANLPIIIDTDAGLDDLLALGYLLEHPNIEIEALTVAYGLAHSRQGSINLARVLAAGHQSHIPVYMGRNSPLQSTAPFPGQWRTMADTLPGVSLPAAYTPPKSEPAEQFLKHRLNSTSSPVRILALGALTNLAGLAPQSTPALEEIVTMGGAFDVRGNVVTTSGFVSPTETAEWNYFVDPLAAQNVIASNLPMTIIPLDATNDVPVTPDFIDDFTDLAHSSVGHLMSQIFSIIRPFAAMGHYYAWIASQPYIFSTHKLCSLTRPQ